MTLTNLTVTMIARLWLEEKPLYLDATVGGKPRRLRLRGCRRREERLEVKVSRDGRAAQWEATSPAKIVCAY